jgi:hypothetical protein
MKVNKMQINAGRSAQCLHCRPALATTTDCLNYGGQGQCSAPRLAGCWRRLNAYHVLFQGLSSDLSAAGCFTRTHPPARINISTSPCNDTSPMGVDGDGVVLFTFYGERRILFFDRYD